LIAVHHEHHHWHSPHLGRDMHVEVYGHAGARVVVFPTTMGTHREWPDRRMHEVLADHLEQGWVQLYCIGQVHDDSWYGKHLHPGHRAFTHLKYDAYVYHELLPFSASRNANPFVIATGASFGAYHAMNFGLRHPHAVHRILGMSGLYDIRHMTGGYTDQNVYACNPVEFVPNEWEEQRLAALRRQNIILAIGRHDPSYENNAAFSGMLWSKGIGNALRVWEGHAHDWPFWEKMLRQYLGGHD
jgi:esterase/lipase superfamily enzyme